MDILEPGMKVECIDDTDRGFANIGCPLLLRAGQIYTIRAVGVPIHPRQCGHSSATAEGRILLHEVRRFDDVPYAANRFRPIRKRETSIEIFKEIVREVKIGSPRELTDA